MNRLASPLRAALPWLLALWIAYIFVWYLQYKFFGHEGSVWLFTVLTDWLGFSGYEKIMRIGVGTAELGASLLCLYRRAQMVGGLAATGIMTGAIFFHVVSPLGIDPYDDGAVLFKEALAVWAAGLALAYLRRGDLPALLGRVNMDPRAA